MVNGTRRRGAAQPPPPARRGRPQPIQNTERAVYEDETGRRWSVLVPQGHPEEAERGMVLGPPDLSGLALPEGIAVRLHNELQARGLLTLADLRGRQAEIGAALQAALRVDVVAIANAYRA